MSLGRGLERIKVVWNVIFVLVLGLELSLSVPCGERDSSRTRANWSQSKQGRLAAVRKQRRLIFNDDSYELDRQDANTAEGFLERRLKPLAGTQVDTIAWSILGGWADAPVYDSRMQPIYGDAHGGPPPYWPHVTDNIKALIKAGRCPLQIVIDFAHANRMEAFASVRMNDVHDSFIEGGLTTWKRQHPEFLVEARGVLPSMELYLTSQDYSHEEVRQRKFEIIQEVAERYDVDGFEFDFIRHPVFFSRTLQGLSVTSEEVEIMSDFMRRIRQLTHEAGVRRGRPLLLAARVPDSFVLALKVGLDLKSWLKEDLLDLLIAGGGYAPFSLPLAEFTQVAREYNVPVYPCINMGTTVQISGGAFLEAVRALAANWFLAGANGLYLWNLGSPFEYKTGQDLITTRHRFYACLSEVGDPEALMGKDKLFCVDNQQGNVLAYYAHVSSPHPLPASKRGPLSYGLIRRIPLMVGDDVETATRERRLKASRLLLEFKGPVRKEALICWLNGEPLVGGEWVTTDSKNHQLSFHVKAPPLKRGRNFIELWLKPTPAATSQTRPEELSSPEARIEFYALKLSTMYQKPD